MTNAHVTNGMLAGYADGSLSDGMSLLVASHLTFCGACRSKVERLEAVGGALMACEEPMEPDPGCLSRVIDGICTPEPDAAPVPASRPVGQLPFPVLDRLGAAGAQISWRFLLPGLADHRIAGFADEDVSLLRAKPGVRILPHTHCGEEATLVLSGALRDGDRVYRRGDVSLADHTDDHRPEIVGDEVCICLVVLSGRMHFTGPIGRALNLLTR